MTEIIEERDRLVERLTEVLGSLVSTVTIDAAEARPLPGTAVVLVEPPTIEYEGWQFVNITWTLDVIAGTMATQTASMDLLMPVLERLHEQGLNMRKAEPVTYQLAGAGQLAAYQITLNPLEI
ncbi:hypothetical protein [Bifidobacterium biavatii]|uniref:DUF3168 domain-containing protein n=1 Tax=Bifidobacterium biavatii DSM 23969 TaxID=1437608 RepID=A0A087A1I0_9BIFI|nr:hypothetical protein [Bifidobacterium biavatii]KFI52630.1 hypothetical protein BBIA_0311 [Bifidobacterium biavatii DSM 23969]